jgi:hypothetical protein
MKYVRAVVSNVVGLFVSDWAQTAGILAILAVGYVAIRRVHWPGSGFLVAAILAVHLVYTTVAEARAHIAKSGLRP